MLSSLFGYTQTRFLNFPLVRLVKVLLPIAADRFPTAEGADVLAGLRRPMEGSKPACQFGEHLAAYRVLGKQALHHALLGQQAHLDGVVEEAHVDRFLDLVDVVAGEEDVGDVRLNQLDVVNGIGICRRQEQGFDV
jgi:hypothetical protein